MFRLLARGGASCRRVAQQQARGGGARSSSSRHASGSSAAIAEESQLRSLWIAHKWKIIGGGVSALALAGSRSQTLSSQLIRSAHAAAENSEDNSWASWLAQMALNVFSAESLVTENVYQLALQAYLRLLHAEVDPNDEAKAMERFTPLGTVLKIAAEQPGRDALLAQGKAAEFVEIVIRVCQDPFPLLRGHCFRAVFNPLASDPKWKVLLVQTGAMSLLLDQIASQQPNEATQGAMLCLSSLVNQYPDPAQFGSMLNAQQRDVVLESLLQMAHMISQSQDTSERALTLLEDAERLVGSTTSPDVALLKADILYRLGNAMEANDIVRTVLQTHLEPAAVLMLVEKLKQAGTPDALTEAAMWLEKVLHLPGIAPEQPMTILVDVLSQLGPSRAAEALKYARQLYQTQRSRSPTVRIMLSKLLNDNQKFAEAQGLVEPLARAQAFNSDVKFQYARALFGLGRLDDALQQVHASLTIDDQGVGPHRLAYKIYERLGDAKHAHEHARRVASLRPRSLAAQLEWADAATAAGDAQDALKAYTVYETVLKVKVGAAAKGGASAAGGDAGRKAFFARHPQQEAALASAVERLQSPAFAALAPAATLAPRLQAYVGEQPTTAAP